ncbi:MAG: M23 family metallopeptidase [Candidatus Taylorbacteria bacterium]|nr:M23 family metallopeptidase [Candidatus Taylorbacteria bacterium]
MLANANRKMIILTTLFFLTVGETAAAPEVKIINPSPYPGDIVIVDLMNPNTASGTFDGSPLKFFSYGKMMRSIFPIPVTKRAADYKLNVESYGSPPVEIVITVRPKIFPRLALGVPKKLETTPKGLVQKIVASKRGVESAFQRETPVWLATTGFGLPLAVNRLGSPFGEMRITGSQTIRHLGADFRGRTGTKVYAIGAGLASVAGFDEIYGNHVILDHGFGVFSFYLHLNQMLIKTGEFLKRGTPIGTIGETGYATGPHLHLTLKVKGVSVDPVRFVTLFR